MAIHQIDRRTALRLLGSGAGVLLAAACAPAAPSASTTTSATSAPAAPAAGQAAGQAAAQPKTGGRLRFAQTANPVSIDGNSIAGGGNETAWLAFDRLTQYDTERKPQPMLAESWDIGSDFKQFKLNLRKNVQFHNGREMTSDDVKYTLLRLRESTVGSGILAGFSNWFTGIDLPDKYTVVLTTDAPRPTFFDAIELFNIVNKENVESRRRQIQDHRHRTVHVRRMAKRIALHGCQEQELLAERTTVSRRNRQPRARPADDGGAARRWRARRHQDPERRRLRATEERPELPGGHPPGVGDLLSDRLQLRPAAVRRQASAPGVQLRHGSQTLRRHGDEGHGITHQPALDADVAGV